GKRAARADYASDLRLAGDDDRYRRDLPGALATRLLRIRLGSAASERHDRPDEGENHHHGADDYPPAAAGSIGHHQGVGGVERGFPVHHSMPNFAKCVCWATVLPE